MIDREHEAEQLLRALDEAPQLVVMRGRRRVGKSYLINATYAGRSLVYFQSDEGDARSHLDQLASELRPLIGVRADFESWDAALGYFGTLAETTQDAPLVVAFDEYQWIQAAQPGLDSVIMRHFDRWQRDQVPIVLVLSGSALSLMESLVEGNRPMFGRASYRPVIEPFDYRIAAELGPAGASSEARIRRFGVLGGTPQYLVWGGKGGIAPMLRERVLAPGTSLSEEPLQLIRGEDEIKEPGNYFSVLRAIATGATHHNEIKTKSKISSGQLLSQRLARLGNLGYIEKAEPLGGNGTSRWRLADPFFAFWFRYVYPNRSRLQMGRVEDVAADIEADLDNYMGHVFERVCRQWAARYAEIPEFSQATEIGGYWTRTHDVEVDLVAKRGGDYLALASCKWSRSAGSRDLDALLAARAKVQGGQTAKLVIFARGFDRRLRERAGAGEVTLVDVDDLFA